MLRFEVHLEDCHFVAEGSGENWKVNLWDSLSGKADTRLWNTKQLSAVLALACGLGEESDKDSPARPMAITYLYRLAEPAVAGLDDEKLINIKLFSIKTEQLVDHIQQIPFNKLGDWLQDRQDY